jgi:predicted RNA methylase
MIFDTVLKSEQISHGLTVTKHLSERPTEDIVLDLLQIQGWLTALPPKGNLLRQNQYKNFSELAAIFKGKSKSGKGDGYPDFLVISETTSQPKIVIETKADEKQIDAAFREACFYADACFEQGHAVLAVGVAGQEKQGIAVRVGKRVGATWERLVYNAAPISWIPTPSDITRLFIDQERINLAPIVPRLEILQEKAEYMNGVLREAHVKDEYRPAYIGAMMLALWQSRGSIQRDPAMVLHQINIVCQQAFERGGKAELARSLHIDEANTRLANTAWKILITLETLNVVAVAVDHDYLGQLYEQFFRYTGGNTIGQYFTPRQITRFMADICETRPEDIIIDPACGTGGFLIAAIQRAYDTLHIPYEKAIEMIRERLIGYDSEPVTAALCVANMILRGDGKTGIRKADSFSAPDYPVGQCQVALMNPPFPHKKTDVPPQQFVARALEALEPRGLLAVVLQTSLLVKKEAGVWRQKLLEQHTLEAVCQLPDELFQPYASATTSVVLIRKGVPHSASKKTVFVRVQHDGLTLKKGARIPRSDGKNELEQAAEAIVNKQAQAGFSGLAVVEKKDEWAVGAYVNPVIPTIGELKTAVDDLMRRLSAFYIRYAQQIVKQRHLIERGQLIARPYRTMMSPKRRQNAENLPSTSNTIGQYFNIYYGQKELHSREGLEDGDTLIISPSEQFNGCYGWLKFDALIQPPFITVAQTGSIGEAFVQLEPCGVNDDCLILMPRPDIEMSIEELFIVASIIRQEKWRFNYGRKLTPARICDFPFMRLPELQQWVQTQWQKWQPVINGSLHVYQNDIDE